MRILLTALCCLLFNPIALAELIPTQELSHGAAFQNFHLSPDGKAVAYSETIQGKNILRILDLETGKKIGLNLTTSKLYWNAQTHYLWLGDEQLIYNASGVGGYQVIKRNGSDNKVLFGAKARREGFNFTLGPIAYNFRDDKNGTLLVETWSISTRTANSYRSASYDPTRPGLSKLYTSTSSVTLVEENPGNITKWIIASDGTVPIAQEIDGTRYRVVYRNPNKANEGQHILEWERKEQEEMPKWIPLPGMDWDDPQVSPLGLGENDSVLYVSRLNENGRWAIYSYDLESKKFGPVILEDKNYDIIPQTNAPGRAGLIYTADRKRLLGIKFQTAYPRVYWLDQGLGEVQVGLDQALKGKVNDIVSMSDDLNKLIIHSRSDRDPGTYYFFDREKQALSPLMQSTPWIKEAQMAKMRPLKFKARDGVTIHGYMSLPVGIKPQNLPLIVLNNGGYWTRNTWYFDRTVQFFANRGYAVLRLNTRGTTGYGEEFKKLGFRKTPDAMHDLADGVKWAVSKKLVNPERVAIIGEGTISGIRSLSAMALTPDIYACGIVTSPYSDWREVINRDRFYGDMRAIMKERIGDPNDPDDPISSLSPVQMVNQITAPVLITETNTTKPHHFPFIRKLINGLEKSGSEVEFIDDYNEEYGFQNYGKWLEDVVAFMDKHMPADQ